MGRLWIRPGTWWLSSKQDPRWQISGQAKAIAGLTIPQEAQAALDEFRRRFGDPPEDLEYGCLKT